MSAMSPDIGIIMATAPMRIIFMLVHGIMAIEVMSHNTQRILGKNDIIRYLFPLNNIAIPDEIEKIIIAQKIVILCHMFKGNDTVKELYRI